MRIHHLKAWPSSYRPLSLGLKTAEYRRNDRGFRIGDTLCLEEWIPEGNEYELQEAEADAYGYTGREQLAKITHIIEGPDFGIPEGYALLSIQRLQFTKVFST